MLTLVFGEAIVLDVHPVHGKMHGFKDFLLHLFTITVGLLIALALEGWVERMHHHEIRMRRMPTCGRRFAIMARRLS